MGPFFRCRVTQQGLQGRAWREHVVVGLKLSTRPEELLVMRVDEPDGETPGLVAGLARAKILHCLVRDGLVVQVACGLVADSGLQIGAVRVRIGETLEPIGLKAQSRVLNWQRCVPFADVGRLIPSTAKEFAIGRVSRVQ